MTETTAAVVRNVDAPFTFEHVTLSPPRDHEVVIEMVAAGLCHTDLSVRSGATPFPLPGVLGHEGAGVVREVGSGVTRVRPGDRVLLSFCSCGRCRSCRAGHPAHCHSWGERNLLGGRRPDGSATLTQNGVDLNGHFFGQSSFAEHALVEESSLVPVAPDVPLEVLAPLGCAVQTGVGTVRNVLHPSPGDSLVIFGAGGVGLCAVMGAAEADLAHLVVVDRVPERLKLAQELGATHTIDASDGGTVEHLRDLTSGGFDHSIEATGHPVVLDQAIAALAPLGTCAIVGAPRAGATVELDIKFMLRGRSLVGVTEGDSDPARFLPSLVTMYQQGRLPLDRLVRHYPFRDLERAANDAVAGTTIKPVVVFDGASA